MFKRILESELVHAATQFPVVTLTGPRQSGKTTLVRHAFPDKEYVNLENPDVRMSVIDDMRGFLMRFKQGVIIDEIQQVPELLSYIQTIVDEDKNVGHFILTGSHQLQQHQAITQSLAGRTAILELLPLSLEEVMMVQSGQSLDELLVRGLYPAIYDKNIIALALYRNYVKTYIERDVRQLVNVKGLTNFQRFIQLAASRVGNILNVESFCNELGISHHTIKNWFSVLESSYLSLRLQPYFENFGKRIIKAPKIYFGDVGIASYLLGIEDYNQMYVSNMRGALFENLVLLELIKSRMNQGKEPNLYYFRDNNGNEVDIIMKRGEYLIPIEIKSSATFHRDFLKNTTFFKKLAGKRVPFGIVVYAGEEELQVEDVHVVNYSRVVEKIESLLSL